MPACLVQTFLSTTNSLHEQTSLREAAYRQYQVEKAMTKRKRVEAAKQDAEELLQYEYLLDQLPSGTRILDVKQDDQSTLREQLNTGQLAGRSALSAALDGSMSHLYRSAKRMSEHERLSSTYKRVKQLLHVESARSLPHVKDEPEDEEAADTDLQVRPAAEKQALMVTSLAGPLFSAVASRLPGEPPLDIKLPQGVHLTRVLPVTSTETGLLMDLHPLKQAKKQASLLDVATKSIDAPKPVEHKDIFNGVRLDADSKGAYVAESDLLPLRFAKRKARAQADGNKYAGDEMMGVVSTSSPDALLDDALIQAYEPQEDAALLLAQLASLQESRFKKDPFAAPAAHEQSLAQQLQAYFAKAIMDKGLNPATLVDAKRKRKGFLLARYAPSYAGSLPPTVDQAVLSTRDTLLPHPEVPPLAKDLFTKASQPHAAITAVPSTPGAAATVASPITSTPQPSA